MEESFWLNDGEEHVGSNASEGLGGILGDLCESPDFLPRLKALQQNPELFNAFLTQIGQRNPNFCNQFKPIHKHFLQDLKL